MRWLLIALVVLLVAVAAASLLQQDPGYLYIDIGRWTLETTLAFALAVLVIAFVALYFLIRLLAVLLRSPRTWRTGLHQRRTEKSRRALLRGLIEMAEGRWERAERLLIRHAPESDTALLNYLAAARAAQQIGAYERRDRYLKEAIEANPEADVAVSLTQAELQLAHHQTEYALATLTRLRGLAPNHLYVIRLLARLYAELEDWERLAELLPELRRHRVFEPDRLEALEQAVALGRLARAGSDSAALTAVWDSLSRRMRDDTRVLHVHVHRLIEAGAKNVAERRLRQHLERQWDERLAREYGLVEHESLNRQLDYAEAWLKDHGRSPMLLLALGRLAARNRLWGKARVYLESSIEAGATAEAYHELGRLLDELGEIGAAREHYRAGLALAVRRQDGPDADELAREAVRRAFARRDPAASRERVEEG